MKIISIIGEANSGKSTTIRHITGIGKPSIVRLERSDGITSVYARTQAPQEPRIKILPLELLQILNDQVGVEYAILPFRTEGVRNMNDRTRDAPPFTDYLRTLATNSHIILEPLIILDTLSSITSSYKLLSFPRMPSNTRANSIKNIFQFM